MNTSKPEYKKHPAEDFLREMKTKGYRRSPAYPKIITLKKGVKNPQDNEPAPEDRNQEQG